jgi:hypothetical protein
MIRHSIPSRRLELEKRCLVVNQKQMLRLIREASAEATEAVCGDRRSIEVGGRAFAFNNAAMAVGLWLRDAGRRLWLAGERNPN